MANATDTEELKGVHENISTKKPSHQYIPTPGTLPGSEQICVIPAE